MLGKLLGANILELLASATFEGLDESEQLKILGRLLSTSKLTGGQAGNPDVFEQGANELLAYSDRHGEGVSISTSPPTGPSWAPLRTIETLDSYDNCDGHTVLALLWETIKLNYRPTTAGSGTSGGTAPAELTSPDTKQQSNEPSSAPPNTPSPGSPPRRTRPGTGITGG